MSWDPLDMYQKDGMLYAYRFNNYKGVMFFKIVSKNRNKLSLVRLLSKTDGMYCKVPAKQKDDIEYKVTVNKNTGSVKIRYEGKNLELRRWDGEPKYDY